MAKMRKGPAKTMEAPTGARYEELRRMLVERQREIMAEVQGKIRNARTEGADKPHTHSHGAEITEGVDIQADIQEDIEFALIQIKAETLNKINEALARLEEGTYGYCLDCGDEIAQPRLRAIPFAIRCKDCEEAREIAERRRSGSSTLGFNS